jgi:hypothetical protein
MKRFAPRLIAITTLSAWALAATPAQTLPPQPPAFRTVTAKRPPLPTRDQILASHETFQGLWVTLPHFGHTVPWFDPAISSLDATDRAAVYAAKHAAGDTAIGIALSWNYDESPGYKYPLPGTDLTMDLPRFRTLVDEAVANGFIPWLFLAGDGETPAGGGYRHPQDWTYGFDWLNGHVCDVLHALGADNVARALVLPGYDGIFYGWEPSNRKVPQFARTVRSCYPNAVIGLEFGAGEIPLGNGSADYAPGGLMTDYDELLIETNIWPETGDKAWQIVARLVGPAYHRPPDQPASDDPRPPFYLRTPTPRGPWGVQCFEWATYSFVRGSLSAADIARGRAYYTALGCPVVD